MMSFELVGIIELLFAVFTDNLLRQWVDLTADGFISYVPGRGVEKNLRGDRTHQLELLFAEAPKTNCDKDD